jgi:type I restriction enzyme S subunit
MSSKTKSTAVREGAKPALVPKLRFPEFREADFWNTDALGNVANFANEKVPIERVALDDYVSTENILPDYGGVAKASKLPTTGSVTRYRPNDTLVSNIRPYLKKVWVADKEGGASNDVIVIRAKQSLLPEYLSCLLKNDVFIDYVMTGAKGVKMPRGDVGSMKAYPTTYPSKAEQQKIAECLSSVDELIAAQARKVEVLKAHKNGLMQQLFPREGETQPRLRLPEFEDAGEWCEGKLINLSSEPLSNGVFNDPKKVGSGYKLINVSDMYIETAIDESRLTLLELSPSDFEANQVIPGDIFFTRSSLVKSGIAVSNIYLGSSNNVTYDGHLIRFRPSPSKVSPLFAHYLFKTEPIRAQLIARGKTATMTTIGQADVASVTLFCPDKTEQQRIAACLSSLDALIVAGKQKLEALKTHKKGLMQQLFPSPEERA